MHDTQQTAQTVLVTGAAGFIGRQVVGDLAAQPGFCIIATDVRPPAVPFPPGCVDFQIADVRTPQMHEIMRAQDVRAVVHLASVVTPPRGMPREELYSIDVEGTRNVLDACLAADVRQIIVTTSGAAYGYWPDNPMPLREDDPLRGHPRFAYAQHKREVEEILAEYRQRRPQLKQLVLRPGTVLGPRVNNQITALFERPFIIGVKGSDSPFVFIWDSDVSACILRGILEARSGTYNLAGDGAVTLPEAARLLGKPLIRPPAWVLRTLLGVLHPLGILPYGFEQVDFLRYRPVLSNERLKQEFGYTPRMTSLDCFREFARQRGLLKQPGLVTHKGQE